MKNRVCIQHSLSIFISEVSLFTTVSFNIFLKMRIESQENLLYVIDKVSYFYFTRSSTGSYDDLYRMVLFRWSQIKLETISQKMKFYSHQGKRSQMFVAGQKKSKRFKTAKELGLEL